ncbi:DUF805 domain-containing protein [Salipiger sp. HF18]|uniref:DUF805 domain-containing protein n=1 Tax=Salipiger sp. HF18 TaxID=2721557 RepID=UPI00142D9322|nr:DUF805 domain-containing protein [Salipiger sp. HF18]NIY96195.1 DUF805 domain-containing protein [Salipiger sp. HF18]
MGFLPAIKSGFRNYATFSGRASRPQFWWWVLFVMLGAILCTALDSVFFGTNPETGEVSRVLAAVFQLVILLPTLAVGFRRMHDTGRPGWYYLLPMLVTMGLMFLTLFGMMAAVRMGGNVPPGDAGMMLGGIWLIAIWLVQIVLLVLMIWWLTRPSDPAPNAYGVPPAA